MDEVLRSPRNAAAVSLAFAALAGGALVLGGEYGFRHAGLYLIGGALGLVLYHAAFGFTAAWRNFFETGDGAGIRAQMLMLALASAVFLPVLDQGTLLGRPVGGAVAPIGTSVAVGAFLFGIGMQLGGGCASGTLYTAGGGNLRMAVTLAAFVAGSVLATAHADWWYGLPAAPAVAMGKSLGWQGALALQLALFAAIAGGSVLWERRRGRRGSASPGRGVVSILRGPWPLMWGAVGLAALNIATLAVSGHPWSITFGFGLWGAKILEAAGADLSGWEFWTWPYPAQALSQSVLAEDTSIMNFGILLGALLAAGLAGRFAPSLRIAPRALATAVVGGLLLGYGARLAFGCNIGAFFSGVASGSLHGWLWLLAALPGNWLGVRLRRIFAPPSAS